MNDLNISISNEEGRGGDSQMSSDLKHCECIFNVFTYFRKRDLLLSVWWLMERSLEILLRWNRTQMSEMFCFRFFFWWQKCCVVRSTFKFAKHILLNDFEIIKFISGMVGNGIRMCFVDRNATMLHRKVIWCYALNNK